MTVGHDRYNDVSIVLGAAIDHAGECMKDALSRLSVVYETALDLGAKGWRGTGPGGKPAHVEEFAHARHFLPLKAYQDNWWNGIQLTLRPVPSYQRHEGMLTEMSGHKPLPSRCIGGGVRRAVRSVRA